MLTGNYTNDAGYVLFKMTSEEYHLMNTKAERNELNKTDQEHYNNAVTVCINKQFKFQITKISDAYFVNKIESIEISRSEEKVQNSWNTKIIPTVLFYSSIFVSFTSTYKRKLCVYYYSFII